MSGFLQNQAANRGLVTSGTPGPQGSGGGGVGASATARALSGGVVTPASTTVVEEEDITLPFREIADGVFYDAQKAEDLGYKAPKFDGILDAFGQLLTGELMDKQPPAEAFEIAPAFEVTPSTSGSLMPDITSNIEITSEFPFIQNVKKAELRERASQAFDDAVIAEIGDQAQDEFNVGVQPSGREVSDLIDEKTDTGQALFYLADTEEQYINRLEEIFGDGNVRVLEASKTLTDLRGVPFQTGRNMFVSVKRDDGTFTDFMPTTVGAADFAERIMPGILAETGASLTTLPTAIAVGGAVGTINPILGLAAFGYTLYVGGKGIEAGRQYLQDTYGLNEEQVLHFESTFDLAKELYTPEWFQDFSDDKPILDFFFTPSGNEPGSTEAEKAQQLSGYIEFGLGIVPGTAARFQVMKSKIYEEGLEGVVKGSYESGIRAMKTVADSVNPSSPMFIGNDFSLQPLMLPQLSASKALERIKSLASQTTNIMQTRAREQMQSVAAYLQRYSSPELLGQGNFKEVADAVDGLGQTLQITKELPGDDNVIRSLADIGENAASLDEFYLQVRTLIQRGKYNNVFKEIGNASYDLDALSEALTRTRRPVGPYTDPTTAGRQAEISPGMFPSAQGEELMEGLIEELMALGRRGDVDGPRRLTKQGVSSANRKWLAENPQWENVAEVVDTPAELIHLYANKFGDLAYKRFAEGGPMYNPYLQGRAIEIRNALLNTLKNPEGVSEEGKDAIISLLDDADAYYRETISIRRIPELEQARISRRAGIPQSGEVPTAAQAPNQSRVAVAEGIVTQQKEVMDFLENPENIPLMQEYLARKQSDISVPLTAAEREKFKVAEQIQNYVLKQVDDVFVRIASSPTGAIKEPAKAIDDFLKQYPDPRHREALGLTDDVIERMRADAELIAKVDESEILNFIRKQSALDLETSDVLKPLFDNINANDTAALKSNFNELGLLIRRAPAARKEELTAEFRRGLLQRILSPESGVFKFGAKQGVAEDIGDVVVDGEKLMEIVESLSDTNVFNTILTKDDKMILSRMAEYAMVVQKQSADAGVALAGAQIYGNLFTVDPRKFISGIARLNAQARIANLFANEDFVKLMYGMGRPMTASEKFKNQFFGKTAIGNAVLNFALRDDADAQMDEMLSAPSGPSFLEQQAIDRDLTYP